MLANKLACSILRMQLPSRLIVMETLRLVAKVHGGSLASDSAAAAILMATALASVFRQARCSDRSMNVSRDGWLPPDSEHRR